MLFLLALSAGLLSVLLFIGLALLFSLCRVPKVPDIWKAGVSLPPGQASRKPQVLAFQRFLREKHMFAVKTASDEGLTLRGVHVPHPQAAGTVILFHDRASSWKLDFAELAPLFYRRGFRLVFAELRAHGQSGGLLSPFGLWERFDVRAWCLWCAERFNPAEPVFLAGTGMGASAALMAASLELPENVLGIVAESPWPSPELEASRQIREKLPLPVRPSLLLMGFVSSLFAGFALRDYDPRRAAMEAELPLLLIHGEKDTLVPIAQAREIYELWRREKRFLPVKDAGHGGCAGADPKAVERALGAFLSKYTSAAAFDSIEPE